MKIVGMVCILNEEEFLDDFFKRNLPIVDLMLVAEGGVYGNPFKTYTGRSIDRTNYILDKWKAKYPDKIKVIRKDNPWNSKQEQQNSMLKYLEDGNWCLILGADEMYTYDARKKLMKLINKYPDITEFVLPYRNYYSDTKHIVVDKEFNEPEILQRHQRFFKYQSGMFYINHPTINDSSNRDTFFNDVYGDKRMILGMKHKYAKYQYRMDLMGIWNYNKNDTVYYYHYGFCRNLLTQARKHIYYLMRDRSMVFSKAIEFLLDTTHNDMDTIIGYIEWIHRSAAIGSLEVDYEHPLKNKLWKSTIVDFNKILKKYKKFEEKPSK